MSPIERREPFHPDKAVNNEISGRDDPVSGVEECCEDGEVFSLEWNGKTIQLARRGEYFVPLKKN